MNDFHAKDGQHGPVKKALHSHGTLVMDGLEPLSFDAIDIGPTGMGIALSRQLNPGQHCRVAFTLLVNGQRLSIAAAARVTQCVCGSDGFKAGLHFIEMNQAGKAAIAKFMPG